jgi:uncharacterized membrane protein YeaQ/YmgE (transglycosylase-associated protein family)
MTFFELSSWLVLGAVLGVLVAAFWRTPGLTLATSTGVGVFGAVVGGLIGRTIFAEGPFSGELQIVGPALLTAGLGALVTVMIFRFQLRNRERPRLT